MTKGQDRIGRSYVTHTHENNKNKKKSVAVQDNLMVGSRAGLQDKWARANRTRYPERANRILHGPSTGLQGIGGDGIVSCILKAYSSGRAMEQCGTQAGIYSRFFVLSGQSSMLLGHWRGEAREQMASSLTPCTSCGPEAISKAC